MTWKYGTVMPTHEQSELTQGGGWQAGSGSSSMCTVIDRVMNQGYGYQFGTHVLGTGKEDSIKT